MGLLDRIHDALTATGGALEAPLGFVKDTVTALPELGTLDFPAFTHDVYKAVVTRGAQEVGDLIGPQGIGGSIAGGIESLPGGQALGTGVGAIVRPVQSGMDVAYHDLIGKPLASAVTAGTFANQDGIGALFKPDTYAESWNIAEHRSPGQSLALAFLTKDIRDPAQVRKAQGTDWYQAISGVTDAVSRTALDPIALALGGLPGLSAGAADEGLLASLAKGGLVGAADASRAVVGSQGAIEALTQSGKVDAFAEHVQSIVDQHGSGAAAAIRNELFPNHYMGAQISDVLANAAQLPAQGGATLTGSAAISRVTRILLGATDETAALADLRPDLAGKIDRLSQYQGALKSLSLNGWALGQDSLDTVTNELNSLYSQTDRADRASAVQASLESLPRPGGAVAMRGRFTQGDFYQNSLFAKPLHVVTAMEPHPWIRLDDANSDISIWRMLQKSDLPLDQQMQWRSLYQGQTDPVGRMTAAAQAENAAVGSIARTAGMSDDELHAVLNQAARGRGLAKQALDSRAYSGGGFSTITLDHEGGVAQHIQVPEGLSGDLSGVNRATSTIEAPLFETQLPNLAPIVDLDKVRAAISPAKQFLARNPGYQVAKEVLNGIADVWKPATLLRVGFPVRTLTDESLRSISKIGVLATVKNVTRGGQDYIAEKLGKIGFGATDGAAAAADEAKFGGMSDMPMKGQRVGLGQNDLRIGSHAFEGAFGPPGDMSNFYKSLLSARESFGSLVSADEGKMLDQLIQSGPWRSVDPSSAADAAAYPAVWEHAVNKQIGGSDLGSHLLEQMQPYTKAQIRAGVLDHASEGPIPSGELVGKTRADIIADTADWLRKDPAGQAVAAKLPIWSKVGYEDWAARSHDMIDSYLPTPELRASAFAGNATHDMLAKAIPNAAERPIAHGGVVGETMGGPLAKTGAAYRNIVDTAMNNLVAKPSNILIRQPFFDHMYNAEVARQVELRTGVPQASLSDRMLHFLGGGTTHAAGDVGNLGAEDMNQIQVNARRYALGETKNLFHDFAEKFQFSKQLGFMAPFSNAWGQILSRWGGIAVDNPAFVRRLQVMWRAPERAGLITDGAGNVLDQNDNIATPVAGNPQYKVGAPAADGQRNITLSVPTWAKDLPIVGAGLSQTGSLKFGKDSINMILHGLPSVGPPVQISANEIAKSRPDLASSLKWALPYGAQQNSADFLVPSVFKKMQTESEGDANRSYAYTAMRIWTDRMVDYNLGKRPDPPKWNDAVKDAQAFWHMRTLASFTLPFTPQFTSPYQPYIDSFRARKTFDATLTPQQKALPSYQTPDEWFLDKYGSEYFPLVASMSKSIDGIPPTLAGQKTHQEFGNLIAQYPELGSLISGASGAGAFVGAVYQAQFNQRIGPGSSEAERQVMPFDTYQSEASTALGWITFGRVMDLLDAVRVQRGLPSFSASGASDLLKAKQGLVAYLANDPHYAGWYEAYASTDSAKWDKRIAGMTAIAANQKLAGRNEIQGLQQYLDGRKAVVAALNLRGSKTLSTQANQQLLLGWDAYKAYLVDHNLAFGALYNRWLQNDPVTVTPITQQAETGTLLTGGIA